MPLAGILSAREQWALENICSLLGLVMGITVEAQTTAALVNVSKYSI